MRPIRTNSVIKARALGRAEPLERPRDATGQIDHTIAASRCGHHDVARLSPAWPKLSDHKPVGARLREVPRPTGTL